MFLTFTGVKPLAFSGKMSLQTIVDNQEQFRITRLVFSSLKKVIYYSVASTLS